MFKLNLNNFDKRKLLTIIPLLIIFLYIPTSCAYAGSSVPSVINIQQNNINFQVKIDFNATTVSGISMQKSITRDISVPVKLPSTTLALGPMGTTKGATSYTGDLYSANVYSVYTKDFHDIIVDGFKSNINQNTTIIRPVSTLNKSSSTPQINKSYALDVATEYRGRNMTNTTRRHTGYVLNAYIPDSRSIASDYCRKNNLILGSILNESFIVTEKSHGVKSLSIAKTESMKTDTNLDDGYSGIPVNASIGTAAVVLIGLAVTAVVLLILEGLGITDIAGIFGDTYIDNSDRSNTTIIFAPEYHMDLPENSSLYEDFLDLCNQSGIDPTLEGYSDFVRDYYGSFAGIFPNNSLTYYVNKSWNTDAGDPTKGATFISGFIESIMPIIILVIIAVVTILGIMIVIKIIQKFR